MRPCVSRAIHNHMCTSDHTYEKSAHIGAVDRAAHRPTVSRVSPVGRRVRAMYSCTIDVYDFSLICALFMSCVCGCRGVWRARFVCPRGILSYSRIQEKRGGSTVSMPRANQKKKARGG